MFLEDYWMDGENLQQRWYREFKLALIQKDAKEIAMLIERMPEKFDSLEMMQESAYLLKSAISFIEDLRDETQLSMQKIKKNIEFIESHDDAKVHRRLDITS